ncbi:MAG: hypothetical protein KAY32_14775 [Candidatus Eisenbacteria sp.]|nr:hypothetical protein [Candidatus Eisenbacteria bacterium]
MPEKNGHHAIAERAYECPRLEPVASLRGPHQRTTGTTADSWNLVCAACSNAN